MILYNHKERYKENAGLKKGEFYSANEYNPTTEYKHFPAEVYITPKEENPCGKEDADLGKEATMLQPKRKPPQNNGSRTLVDKIFNSFRGVATAATVAVASVIVTTSIITTPPKAELVSLACGATYVEYEMEISGLQDDINYSIVVSITNETTIEIALDGDGTYQNKIDGLTPDWEYTLSVVHHDTFLGEVRHFETTFQTLAIDPDPMPEPEPTPDPEPMPEPEPEPAPIPQVAVTGVKIVGLNKIQIDFTYEHLTKNDRIEFDLLYGDSTTDTAVATGKDLTNGYVTVNMENSDTLTITPTAVVDGGDGETQTPCESYTHTFTETLMVDTMVDLYSKSIVFYPMGITNGAEYLHVTSSLAPDLPELLYVDDSIMLWYDTEEVIAYTMYLTNEQGDVLSGEVSVTVDTSTSAPTVEYQMQYLNPSDVCITYNDDGTVNMYIQTEFTSDNEDVYYQITVGSMRYKSREKLLKIEHIPDESYPLQYDVCIDIDGVQYSIFHVSPSGVANEPYFLIESSLEGNILSLVLYKDIMYVDMNSVKLISSSGEEISLSETDFIYNEEYGLYEIMVEFTQPLTHVVIQMQANPYHEGLEELDDYVGNARKTFEETVYEP